MPFYLGIDTSNYTTSASIYNSDNNIVTQNKMLLPVKGLGIRQSDAVFHHTVQLPVILKSLFEDFNGEISAVSVSTKPRNSEGSYMPCFLAGKSVAYAISLALKIPYYETSHQTGHILAALYSADKLELIKEPFIAFHVSGGTTDCLLVEPDDNKIIKITEIGTSLDLKAGQAVDRVGLMLGLSFPCGTELEKLAFNSDKKYKIKPSIKENSCSLSGVENKCRKMFDIGEKREDIAMFCLSYIYSAIKKMAQIAREKSGSLPIVFSGGVMADKIIKEWALKDFENVYFAEPQFSCDNATGVAVYGYLSEGK